jgi:hypothetical protein
MAGSHPDLGVGPESEHVSDLVAFGFLAYVNLNETALLASVAPSAGDGDTNVIAVGAALATDNASVATPSAVSAATITNSGFLMKPSNVGCVPATGR